MHGLACLRLLCVLPGRHHGVGRLSSCLVSLRGRELAWWSLSPAPSSPTAGWAPRRGCEAGSSCGMAQGRVMGSVPGDVAGCE